MTVDWHAAYRDAVQSMSTLGALPDPPVPSPYPNLIPAWANAEWLSGSSVPSGCVIVPAATIPGLGASYDDATSINAAFAGAYQTVRLCPGQSYVINTPIVPPPGGGTLVCDPPGATLVTTTASAMVSAAAQVTGFEIAGVTFDATGCDIFSGANCVRWHVHDCGFIQRSAGNAIWNAPAVTLMIECRFERNTEQVYGAARTIPAWQLVSPSSTQQVNACSWRDSVCFNRGADASQYWYHLVNTGNINIGNTFTNCVFENPLGGMISLESAKNFEVDSCMGWDFTGTVANHLISVTKNATGNASYGGLIRNSGRATGGVTFAASITDTHFDANCDSMLVLSPVGAASQYPVIDVGTSTGTVVIGHATLTNQAVTTLVAGNGQLALNGSVYTNP